jgi:hypothetical protein
MTDEMNQFRTRPQANSGTRLALKNPVTGADTGHWLQVLGEDSDAFREEGDASRRRLQDALASLPAAERNAAKYMEIVRATKTEEKLLGIASLVSSWSFAPPCSRENVIAWLRDAPQIQDAIDLAAGDRSNFLASDASSSTSTPNPSSSSTESQQEAPQTNP